MFDCLRVARLTGDCPKDEVLTVGKAIGNDKKTPALAHLLFKKQDLIEFIMHEAELLDHAMLQHVHMFLTPFAVTSFFASTGEHGLVDTFLNGVPVIWGNFQHHLCIASGCASR